MNSLTELSPQTEQIRFFDTGEDRYVAWPVAESYFLPLHENQHYATILPIESRETVTPAWLEGFIGSDDVIRREFLESIVFVTSSLPEESVLTPDCQALLESWGSKWTVRHNSDGLAGPFWVAGKGVWQIYRLYDDCQGAFLCSVRPTAAPGYESYLHKA